MDSLKILLVLTAFKSSLTAKQACLAAATGIKKGAGSGVKIVLMPVSDGGDGFLEAVQSGRVLRLVAVTVTGPLGRPIRSRYLMGTLEGHKTAFIEAAKICGLAQIAPGRRDPMRATSFGVGQAIRHALENGAAQIYLGLGGTATQDAGCGMAQALGYRLLDGRGRAIPRGAAGIGLLDRIDSSGVNPRLGRVKIFGLCDVVNPLLGKLGSTRVYAPQKGATPSQVAAIERHFKRWDSLVKRDLGLCVGGAPGAGAAGGLGAAILAFGRGKILPGTKTLLEILNAERLIQEADIVIVGEGKLDRQTLYGKAPGVLSERAKKAGKKVWGIFGQADRDAPAVAQKLGLDQWISLTQLAGGSGKAMAHAYRYVSQAAFVLAQNQA
ncbi:MAG: glycerate kinase [Elusimicrobia bacterium]|nr:glycerate kinase [Elusimicrobiota bacterium]